MSTVFPQVVCFVLAAVAAVAAVVAVRAANAAAEARDELASQLRQVRGLREDVVALGGRLDRLAGRVYTQARRAKVIDGEYEEVAPTPPAAPNGAEIDIDPALAATLALQGAPPVRK